MTDRELLERAAKAAGIDAAWHPDYENDAAHDGMWLKGNRSPDNSKYWNPLLNDGDALRLAVVLRISLDMLTYIVDATTGTVMCHEPWDDDHNAATRRAIVRAAAAMEASAP